jgi:alpha-ketoglutarate-dependent 2,4-dichlorophenoxyacetate dioxygenase
LADTRAAYDALDDATKALVEDLPCEHSRMFSRAKLGFTDFAAEERQRFKHPRAGRKSLGTIVEWAEP